MNNNKLFFNKKKILITGVAGFKGSWLALILLNFKATIYGVDKKITKKSLFNLLRLEKKIYFKKLDLNNKNLKSYIEKIKPDIIYHFAANSLVLDSYKAPLQTIKNNIFSTSHLLDCIRKIYQNKKIILIISTSDKVYKPSKKYLKENDTLGGKDIYSVSKACKELISYSFYESFFKNKRNITIATVRAGNVIGPGDYSKNRIVPDLVNFLTKNNNIVLRNPNQIRPWQHILDCLNGYISLTIYLKKTPEQFSNWNLGPKSEDVDVHQLTKKFIKYWQSNKKIKIEIIKSELSENNLIRLNSNKSRYKLKWNDKFEIDELIKDTAETYKYINKHFKHPGNILLKLNKNIKSYYNK